MKLFRRAPLVLAVALGACTDPAPTTGALVLSVDGLPAGAPANVSVSGPNGYVKAVPGTTTLEELAPGTYTVRVAPTSFSGSTYAVAAAQTTYEISAGKTENAGIHYLLASGAIDLSIAGLPAGITPNVLLKGPFGFRRSVLRGGVIGELPPGTYAIQADTITTSEGDRFGSGTYIQNVDVPVSTTAIPASVAYSLASGILDVTVTGLPNTQTASVSITGPEGFQRSTATSVTYHGVLPGTYTITASKVYTVCPNVYVPSQSQQTVPVSIGTIASRAVSYALTQESASTLNLKIDAVTLTQVTQNYAGTVPMIAGRPALLRVHGMANQCNAARPKVRLTIGGATVDLTSTDSSVATSVNEGSLASTWNYAVPGSVIQPGLTFAAQIDPANEIAEADESDNRYPASGSKAVDVRTMPVTPLKLVPVTVSATNTTGGINAANVDDFLKMARKLHPVSGYTVEIRPPYTTTTSSPLQANNQNNAWGTILSEVRALQTAANDGYYYGVLKVTYTSGVAGIGYIGAPAAIGWDYLPSAATVLAHELGHNFGRFHSPCGNPGGIDPDYPANGFYAGGYVGTYGYDSDDASFKSAAEFTDIMGYCNNVWISDYTYVGMMNWLLTHQMTQPAVSTTVQPSLLVWGRTVNGVPTLEPAFEISARPQLPASGPNRLTALDEGGAELFSIPFAADRIADLPGDEESFALVVPRSMLRGRALGALRLTARGRSVTNAQAGDVGAEPGVTLARAGSNSVRLRWDAARFPVIMVRDPASGDILSFARGGDATIVTGRPELELNYSNRVRSARRVVRVR